MIDLHTHTYLSDGALGPAEHVRRAEVAGYRVLGMSDHVDLATLPVVLPQLLEAARRENATERMTVLAGVEFTHIRPEQFGPGTQKARELGAHYVIAHGETIAEPVIEGTNRAAIEAGVDILAHPGLISEADAKLAASRNVLLEISGKGGHCLCNGHVALMAHKTGAQLIFGSDAHEPGQMRARAMAERICRGAGLRDEEIAAIFERAEAFARHRLHQAEMDQTPDW